MRNLNKLWYCNTNVSAQAVDLVAAVGEERRCLSPRTFTGQRNMDCCRRRLKYQKIGKEPSLSLVLYVCVTVHLG